MKIDPTIKVILDVAEAVIKAVKIVAEEPKKKKSKKGAGNDKRKKP
ncbi:MAG: hypothetical protein ACYC09_11255 [Bacteroidota bacterium]|jgi:hypothetical protein